VIRTLNAHEFAYGEAGLTPLQASRRTINDAISGVSDKVGLLSGSGPYCCWMHPLADVTTLERVKFVMKREV